MTGITEAAMAERDAERSRNQTLMAWRAAWWETTMVLAEAPRAEIGETYRRAEIILGQSRRYLNQRRQLGQRLSQYDLPDVRGLPPRLALLYALQVKADPARIHEVLKDAQERELSLRDLAKELGSQPDSWKRQDERVPLEGRPAARSEAGAVLAALEALARTVTALAAAPEPADPAEIAEVARSAKAIRPSVDWLISLDARISAA